MKNPKDAGERVNRTDIIMRTDTDRIHTGTDELMVVSVRRGR